MGTEGRVYKTFPLLFPLIPNTSLEGQKIFVNQHSEKMAPFSPLVCVGWLSGEGHTHHSNAPTTKELLTEKQCLGAESRWHHPADLVPVISDTIVILNILSHRPHQQIQKRQAWSLTFGSNNTPTRRKPRTSPIPSFGNLQT